ncbi:Tudor domain protein [Trichostrongylus colubriformis]|uniref:Tudor domain protein n=1 Tax=Trichostrongylus colubriformis TaxID=6319 RepID=A0AAN8FIA8_TRICO
MDQSPSGSASTEFDKEFCVKNIPAHFFDWDVFRIFCKFGTVHNVKLPSKQLQSNTKYGFVIMENINGADEIRCHLKNGKYLNLDNGLQLLVTGVRHGENQRSRDGGRGPLNSDNKRPALKDLPARDDGAITKGRGGDRYTTQKTQRSFIAIRCFSQDLPLQTPTRVRVVESPYPCKSVSEGFMFHVLPIGQKLGDEYACLQREMNKFCMENPNITENPKIGQYVLYCRDTIAFRALCNRESTLYLVDIGELVPIIRSQLWEMIPSFTTLPSLVVPCGIAGVSWKKPTVSMFNNCRNALKKWSESCPTGLTATAHEYCRLVNMIRIQLVSDQGIGEDFAESIIAKGYCTGLSPSVRVYSRDDLLEAKNTKASDRCPPITFNENVAEIVIGLKAITVA